jgi:hypothetical protein
MTKPFEKISSFWTLFLATQIVGSAMQGHYVLAVALVFAWLIGRLFVFKYWSNAFITWLTKKQYSLYDMACLVLMALALVYVGLLLFMALAIIWSVSSVYLENKFK